MANLNLYIHYPLIFSKRFLSGHISKQYFGMWRDLVTVIKCAKFGQDWSMDFLSADLESYPLKVNIVSTTKHSNSHGPLKFNLRGLWQQRTALFCPANSKFSTPTTSSYRGTSCRSWIVHRFCRVSATWEHLTQSESCRFLLQMQLINEATTRCVHIP